MKPSFINSGLYALSSVSTDLCRKKMFIKGNLRCEGRGETRWWYMCAMYMLCACYIRVLCKFVLYKSTKEINSQNVN